MKTYLSICILYLVFECLSFHFFEIFKLLRIVKDLRFINNFQTVRHFLQLHYSCFCLPEGSHNIAAGGYGVPVDNIDRSCLEFKQCYKCLIAEHAGDFKGIPDGTECRGEDHGYKMNLTTENGTNKITCLNPVGTCRRNI